MAAYIGLLRKDSASDYGVDFPDFPGCITAGRVLEEARRMATKALELHVTGMIQYGEPIPEPSGLDEIVANPGNREAVIMVVELHAKPVRSIRVNVMLPEDLVQAIDRKTSNRSRFLADAAGEKLHIA